MDPRGNDTATWHSRRGEQGDKREMQTSPFFRWPNDCETCPNNKDGRAMILYDLPISSYGCKTRILLRHKNLQWRSVAPPDGYGSEAYCQIIPAGTIPALDDNGFKLSDSEAIAESVLSFFLEINFADPAVSAEIIGFNLFSEIILLHCPIACE